MVAMAIVLIYPAEGWAATIGSDLRGTPTAGSGYGCGGGPCTTLQVSLSGDRKTRAPFSGVIRKWRFRTTFSAGAAYELRLSVVRKAAPGRWKFIRTSRPREVGTAAGTYVFPAHLRIKRGDFIGLDLPAGMTYEFLLDQADDRGKSWFPTPPDGLLTAPTYDEPGYERLYNATIRHR